jgi:uncharacterized phage protein (TIGR02220 family)
MRGVGVGMAKLPYMQFYPADYQADMRRLSLASQGAWMQILCVLWRAPKRGQVTLTLNEWAKEVGCLESELSLYFTDLKHHNICTYRDESDGKITIISRRIVRDERNRKAAAKRQKKHRDSQMSQKSDIDVTAKSQGYIRNQISEVRNQKSYSEEEKKEETTSSSSGELDDIPPPRNYRADAREVLDFLNAKTGRQYRPVESTIAMIVARLKGQNLDTEVDVQTCKSLIAKKVRDWNTDEKMAKYLRPETLFNRTKFESYLGELNLCAVQNATKPCSTKPPDVPVAGELLRSL